MTQGLLNASVNKSKLLRTKIRKPTEFHESTCNGFGDIWWTDNPIYLSSIDNVKLFGFEVGLVPEYLLQTYNVHFADSCVA